jgi:hypothetical protein
MQKQSVAFLPVEKPACSFQATSSSGGSARSWKLRLSTWARFVMLFLMCCSIVPDSLHAQVGSADVLGTVTDPTGAVIVGAKVTIKNLGTAATRVATSSDKGEYIFTTLPNGSYSLTVELDGFKSYTLSNFALSTGERSRHDAVLTAGSTTETVEVTADAAVMQTDSAEVASTIQDKAVQDLPLNSRNFSSALTTQAGMSMGATSGSMASGTAPEDRRPSFVVVANGQNDNLNNQLIDGFDNNERDLGLAGVRPSIDGIEEVKIDTSSYSAEYGRAAGAVINVITKQGTNDFHGSAYEYFRNDIFDSRDFFSKKGTVAKPEYRLNSFGGSVGGPVRKNKTFFFADVEQDRMVKGLSSSLITVPTLYEQNVFTQTGALDLTDADTSLGVVPATAVNPIMANYFKLYPTPNYTGASSKVGYYTNTPSETQTNTNIDGRIDHHFGSNDTLFVRGAYNPVHTLYPETVPMITSGTLKGIYPGGNGQTGHPGPSDTKSFNGQIDYVHIFNEKLLMDLKMGFTRVDISSLPFNYDTGAAQTMGFASDIDTGKVLPSMGGPSIAWTMLLGSTTSVPFVDINNTYQYAGSINYTHGSHNIKAGADFIRRQVNAYQDADAGGFFLFFDSGTVASGLPYSDSRQNFISGHPGMEIREDAVYKPGFRTWELAGYVQDDWRVSPKLTVNMGVRYDVFTPFTEAHGRYANFETSCLSSGTIGSNCFVTGAQKAALGINTDRHDVSPRVGFAYTVNNTTVLRGGFGMSFFPLDTGEASIGSSSAVSVMQNYNPPYSFNYQKTNPYGLDSNGNDCTITSGTSTYGCISQGPVQATSVDLSTFASNVNVTSVSAKPNNVHSSYVYMANLAVQKQVTPKDAVTVAYVGEFGRGLLRAVNLDQPAPPGAEWAAANSGSASLIFASELPNVSMIASYYNGTMSSYNALQLSYNRQLSHGFTANANYTWSHNLTNSQTAGALFEGSPESDYGNSNNDLRHRVSVTASYEIPFAKSSNSWKTFLGRNWKLNAIGYWQTGSPFTVIATSVLRVPNISQDRPNITGSAKKSNPSINEWFDMNAFTTQSAGTQGNERIGQLFGPHMRNVDLSAIKDFKILEKLKGEFRAECFNLSNTPNFGTPDNNRSTWDAATGTSSNATFGEITSTQTGSNPREFQFAMKFLF